MEQKPRLTISGYRGIWGKDLNEQITFDFILAFAKIIKKRGGKKILVGRDARGSGPLMLPVVISAIEKEGLEAEDVGIIPTPSVLLLQKELGYDGSIIITASHNPKEYNGLKFVMNSGLFASPEEIEEINEIKNSSTEIYTKNSEVRLNDSDNHKFRKIHIKKILDNIDVSKIKEKKYKVTLDPINSAGSVIVPELLRELGCEVSVINGEQNGEFAHEPEPLAKNLTQLSEAVKKNDSDIGFAVDPDADRLVLVDENGNIIADEYTITLALKNILAKEPSDVAVNMSTSRMCEDIANAYGQKLIRTKVGELNVTHKMLEINSNISGEGNGGVIYPKINLTRDSLVGITLILQLMAEENKSISEIINEIPKYILRKEKITFHGNLEEFYQKLETKFTDATVNTLDGIRFDWPDFSWIHIRPSNTEPIVRIYSEAKDDARIDFLLEEVKSVL